MKRTNSTQTNTIANFIEKNDVNNAKNAAITTKSATINKLFILLILNNEVVLK